MQKGRQEASEEMIKLKQKNDVFAIDPIHVMGYYAHFKDLNNAVDAESHIKIFTKTGEVMLFLENEEIEKIITELEKVLL